MKSFKIILSLVILLATTMFAQFPFGKQYIEASYYPSFDKVYAGSEFKLAVDLKIEDSWHVNANKPNDENLIPTEIIVKQNNTFSVQGLYFPKAHEYEFSFSEEPVAVYDGLVTAGVLVTVAENAQPGDYELPVTVSYQACNDQTCMPPMELDTVLTITVAAKTEAVNQINAQKFDGMQLESAQPTEETKDDDSLQSKLEKSGLILGLIIVFLGGLALNLTPCVYPLIPITVGYFGSQSEGSTGKLFGLGVLYVLGMALTYSVVGVVTSLSGAVFGALLQNTFVILAIVAVLFALSLSMFGLYEFKFPDSWVMKAGGARAGGVGAFFMGLTMGIVAAPCIGPFVLGLVAAVAAKGDPLYGFIMFFTLAVGLGTPYLILAVFSGKLKSLPRAGFWMEAVKHIFGLIMIAMALYFLAPILPKSFSGYVLPVYGIGAALYLMFIDKVANNQKGFRIFKIALSVLVIAVSAYLLVPTEKKAPDWQKFTTEAYQSSLANNDKMIIDFYADWCIPCKELDALTFSDDRIIAKSKEYTMYKVDMTKTASEETERIRKQFEIKGMPTILIIDANGNEIKRLTGFVPADEFLEFMK